MIVIVVVGTLGGEPSPAVEVVLAELESDASALGAGLLAAEIVAESGL